MAGSYKHVTADDGKLLENRELVDMVGTGGDVYEAIEEMYGMIWFLARNSLDPKSAVEFARKHYREGLTYSPGLDGTNRNARGGYDD